MRSVSVVVCTRDRPAALAACLRSLADESPDEVLVIDNASSPPARSTEPVRIVVHREPGLSAARNRGLAEATSEVVLFLDDDATAKRGVVAAHAAAYEPGVMAVGGRIAFAPTTPPPRWLDPSLEEMLSTFDRGPSPKDLERQADLPYGANLSVDRAAALDLGGFDTGLGKGGRRTMGYGEETDLLVRMRSAGGRVRWCPTAVVDHHIPSDRLRLRWFVRRAWVQGRTDIETRRRRTGRREALSLLKMSLRPWGTEWPPSGPPAVMPRLAVELVRRTRFLAAALTAASGHA